MTLREAAKFIWREWLTSATVLCAAVALSSSFAPVTAAEAAVVTYRSGDIPFYSSLPGPPDGGRPSFCQPSVSFSGLFTVNDGLGVVSFQFDVSDGFSINSNDADLVWGSYVNLMVSNRQLSAAVSWAGRSSSFVTFTWNLRFPDISDNTYMSESEAGLCYYHNNAQGILSGPSIQTSFPKTLGVSSGVTAGSAGGGAAISPVASLDNLGECNPCMKGNPINAATGNKFQVEEDFVGGPHMLLALRRFYNSQDTTATSFGVGWRSTWHRTLKQVNATTITATRADGRVETYIKNTAGLWLSEPDVTNRLTPVSGGGWKLTDKDDNVESYTATGRLASITTRAGLVTTLSYDTSGRLTRISDMFNHAITFGYDTLNRINQMNTPDGITRYDYDTNNNLTFVTWPDGEVRRYVYENLALPNALTGIVDEKGIRFATWAYNNDGGKATLSQHADGVDKTTITYNADGTVGTTDARGNTHTTALTTQFGMVKPTAVTGAPVPNAGGKAFTYHPATGFLASRTDFNGNVTSYTHDARGNEISRTEAVGKPQARTISTTWHPTLHVPTRIVEPNRVMDIVPDAKGNPLTITTTAGIATRRKTFTYDAVGHVKTIDGPRTDVADITKIDWGTDGNPLNVTNAAGHITRYTWYPSGRLKTVTDPNGLVMTFTYTPRGFLNSVTEGTEVTRYTHDAVGNITRVTMPDGSYLAYTYDDAHRLTDVVDALGNRKKYTLDLAGNVTKEEVRDPAGALARTQSLFYDNVDRLRQIVDGKGKITNITHDPNGNLTKIVNPVGAVTTTIPDPLNRPIRSIDPKGFTTQQDWDANDNLKTVTDPRGLVTSYGYNGLGDNTAINSPDTGATTMVPDAAGNVITTTDARGKLTRMSYDALNRLTQRIYADGKIETFRYDEGVNGKGHLTSMTDTTGTTSWKYDLHGREIEKTQTVGTVTRTLRHGYDSAGRLATITYPSGKVVRYQYNVAGLPVTITLNGAPMLSQIHYKPFGPADAWKIGNDGTVARGFDLNGDITGIGVKGSANLTGDTTALLRDAARRVITLGATGQATKSFGYSLRDELTLFKAGTALTQELTHDKTGNRLTQKSTRGTVVTTETYAIATASNRLSSITTGMTTRPLAHDTTGNQTGDGTGTWLYDARNRLVRWSTTTKRVDYLINGLGERVRKNGAIIPGGTVHFLYDGSRLLGEYGPTGALLQETVWLGELPVMVIKPTANYFITPDHRGAPHAITLANGRTVWTWNPDPFGTTAPNQNPTGAGNFVYNLRYPGQYFDAETGSHYNMARDYNPSTGRYIQSDPIGLTGGVNTYGYVGGNPVNAIDPTGTLQDNRANIPTITIRPSPRQTGNGGASIGNNTQCKNDYIEGFFETAIFALEKLGRIDGRIVGVIQNSIYEPLNAITSNVGAVGIAVGHFRHPEQPAGPFTLPLTNQLPPKNPDLTGVRTSAPPFELPFISRMLIRSGAMDDPSKPNYKP